MKGEKHRKKDECGKSFWARVVSRWIHILFQLVPPQSHSIFYSLSTISFWINITFIFQHVVKKYHIYSEWGKWESFVNKIGFFLSHPQVVYNLWLFSFFNSIHNFTHSSISHLSASNYHYLDRISFFSLRIFDVKFLHLHLHLNALKLNTE